MTEAVARKMEAIVATVTRPTPRAPVFALTSATSLSMLAGVTIVAEGITRQFGAAHDVPINNPLEAGGDYVISLGADNSPIATRWTGNEAIVLGGFHFAPGGNATARAGGDDVPQINPLSIWDIGFRPSCADPRGMVYVAGVPGSESVKPFWVDIYLLVAQHLELGSSAFGSLIADGNRARPVAADGKPEAKLDFTTAKHLLEGHGKGLLSFAEFAAATYGVTERTSADNKPTTTGLDAARTSACGMMQATGNLYVWGHDGDPDTPRASVFGGSWGSGEFAGSRYAVVGDWPGNSYEWIGARGRSDHLQLD
jgi:hypothetical protein